jgi:hypothetical protein
MTFGIPIDSFPITLEGTQKKANHLKWIAKRKIKESIMVLHPGAIFYGIDLPTRNDVLFGKGKPYQQHSGNLRLRSLVELRIAEYSMAKKSEKSMHIRDVVQVIKNTSDRFLKEDIYGWWVEVSDSEAREKVSKTFTSIQASGRSLSTEMPSPTNMASRKDANRIRVHGQMGCFGFCE